MVPGSVAEGHPLMERLFGSPPALSFYSKEEDRPGGLAVARSYSNGARRESEVLLQHRHRSHKARVTSAVAALASMMAVVMLIAICAFGHKRVAERGIVGRLLSDAEDSSGSGRLPICEGTDGGSDDVSSPEPPAAAPQEEVAEPSAKLAKLEASETQEGIIPLTASQPSLQEAATSSAQHGTRKTRHVTARHSRRPPRGRVPRGRPHQKAQDEEPQPSTSAVIAAQQFTGVGTMEAGAPSPSLLSDEPTSRSQEDLAAASGLLLLVGDAQGPLLPAVHQPQQPSETPAAASGPTIGETVEAPHQPVTTPADAPAPTNENELAAASGLLLLLGDTQAALLPAGHQPQQPSETPAAASGPTIGKTVDEPHAPSTTPTMSLPPSADVSADAHGSGQSDPSPAASSQDLQGQLQQVPSGSQGAGPPEPGSVIPATSLISALLRRGPPVLSSPEQPSTSSASAPVAAIGIHEHAYYHVPRVLEPNAPRRPFDPQQALTVPGPYIGMARVCRDLHMLLAKEALTPEDMNILVEQTEILISYMATYERSNIPVQPSRAALPLGRRFIGLDIIVCALQVMGEQASGQWWQQLISAVPHAFATPKSPQRTAAVLLNHELVFGLRDALASLKTGVRPGRDRIVRLKRLLFCSQFSPFEFKLPVWDPWRADEARFRGNNSSGASSV